MKRNGPARNEDTRLLLPCGLADHLFNTFSYQLAVCLKTRMFGRQLEWATSDLSEALPPAKYKVELTLSMKYGSYKPVTGNHHSPVCCRLTSKNRIYLSPYSKGGTDIANSEI